MSDDWKWRARLEQVRQEVARLHRGTVALESESIRDSDLQDRWLERLHALPFPEVQWWNKCLEEQETICANLRIARLQGDIVLARMRLDLVSTWLSTSEGITKSQPGSLPSTA